MTPEEFKKQMEDIWEHNNPESGHENADNLMCELLRSLGYGDGVDIFNKEYKWYA